jgi:hypothetical protein
MRHVDDGSSDLSEHAVDAQALADHLIDDHGRSAHEISGLPLHAVHELEHVEEAMGLLGLRHSHTS